MRRATPKPQIANGRIIVVAVLLFGVSCTGLGDSAHSSRSSTLYVANGIDGTISQIDGASGRAIGPPFPAGPGPAQMALGPDGTILVLSAQAEQPNALGIILPDTPARRSRTWRSFPTEARRGGAILAGTGGRYAALAYKARAAHLDEQEGRCRLALIDLLAGAVERSHRLCRGEDDISGLALGTAGDALTPIAFAGIWQRSTGVDGQPVTTGGKIVALDTLSGRVLASEPLPGVPQRLVLAPGPDHVGLRLFCVVAELHPEHEDQSQNSPRRELAVATWRLLRLDPVTLAFDADHPLRDYPRSLTVAPDGGHAYAFRGPSQLVQIDLATGAESLLKTLPGPTVARIAVTSDKVFVPDSFGSHAWVIDRRSGRVVRTVPTGRHPLDIVVADTHSATFSL